MAEYNYKSELQGLDIFYKSMKVLNVRIGTFEFKYNKVESDVIFDTRYTEQWYLVFIKRDFGNTLKIPINKGYKFTIIGNEKYREFINYFNIQGGKGHFSIKEFKENLESVIPNQYIVTDNTRKQVIKYDRIDDDSEGIYPVGIKNCEEIHAKNPELPKEKYHRTNKNLEKTRELYPKIYDVTKDKDITIIYRREPSERTKSILSELQRQ